MKVGNVMIFATKKCDLREILQAFHNNIHPLRPQPPKLLCKYNQMSFKENLPCEMHVIETDSPHSLFGSLLNSVDEAR